MVNENDSTAAKPANASKGRIWIRIVEARNLIAPSEASRPYCVVEFEKNDFVTREAVSVSFTPVASRSTASDSDQKTALSEGTGRLKGLAGESEQFMHPIWKHEASLYFK